MSISGWFKKLGRRKDEAAVERASEMAVESPEEREETAGGIEGMKADEAAARGMHEGSIKDAERLGE